MTAAPLAAIIDFGMGNLFSVRRACEIAGADATITSERAIVEKADAIVLPGVGAFGDAMDELVRRDLVSLLRDRAKSGTPIMGICLGMQLFMTESCEFGAHKGLNLIEGCVEPLDPTRILNHGLRIPHVGWNRVACQQGRTWKDTPLGGLKEGSYLYFVHSFHAVPAEDSDSLARTRYGGEDFCASVLRGNIFACQFHPERSGDAGLDIYRRFFSNAGR